MILPDSNVWLALALSEHGHHGAAKAWLETVEGLDSVAFCRATQQALLRLLTNTAVLRPYGNEPLSNRAAWSVFEAFLEDDRITLRPDEPAGLERRWREYALRDDPSPKLWMDAYLAAFAAAAGYRLATTDRAFRQFAGLQVALIEPAASQQR